MRRIRLFEFEDLAWFPKSIRDAGTDMLRYKWQMANLTMSHLTEVLGQLCKPVA